MGEHKTITNPVVRAAKRQAWEDTHATERMTYLNKQKQKAKQRAIKSQQTLMADMTRKLQEDETEPAKDV